MSVIRLSEALDAGQLLDRSTRRGLLGYLSVANLPTETLASLAGLLADWLAYPSPDEAVNSRPPFEVWEQLDYGVLYGGPGRGLLDDPDGDKVIEHWTWLHEIATDVAVAERVADVAGDAILDWLAGGDTG
jgi:hypothetical protein